jgi:hypothetical protein
MNVVEELNEQWKRLTKWFEQAFGMESDPESILFIVGVQELGKGVQEFNKTEKVELIHIGVCAILTDKGYYRFSHKDADGWPHYENIKKLPVLKGHEQDQFMKEALVSYFKNIIA